MTANTSLIWPYAINAPEILLAKWPFTCQLVEVTFIRKSGNPDIRIYGYPDFRISAFPDIRMSGIPENPRLTNRGFGNARICSICSILVVSMATHACVVVNPSAPEMRGYAVYAASSLFDLYG